MTRRPGCTCNPGHRCQLCTDIGAAILRMFRLNRDISKHTDPVAWWDQQTSMHDARALLSLAAGAPLADIDRNGYRRTPGATA